MELIDFKMEDKMVTSRYSTKLKDKYMAVLWMIKTASLPVLKSAEIVTLPLETENYDEYGSYYVGLRFSNFTDITRLCTEIEKTNSNNIFVSAEYNDLTTMIMIDLTDCSVYIVQTMESQDDYPNMAALLIMLNQIEEHLVLLQN